MRVGVRDRVRARVWVQVRVRANLMSAASSRHSSVRWYDTTARCRDRQYRERQSGAMETNAMPSSLDAGVAAVAGVAGWVGLSWWRRCWLRRLSFLCSCAVAVNVVAECDEGPPG